MIKPWLAFALGLLAWTVCAVGFCQEAPTWPEIPEPTPKREIPKWVRIIGDGTTTGMPCVVSTATGLRIATIQPGTAFVAFNIDAQHATFPYRGRIGRVPRTAVVMLNEQEMMAAQARRDNEEAAARERGERLTRASDTPKPRRVTTRSPDLMAATRRMSGGGSGWSPVPTVKRVSSSSGGGRSRGQTASADSSRSRPNIPRPSSNKPSGKPSCPPGG